MTTARRIHGFRMVINVLRVKSMVQFVTLPLLLIHLLSIVSDKNYKISRYARNDEAFGVFGG